MLLTYKILASLSARLRLAMTLFVIRRSNLVED